LARSARDYESLLAQRVLVRFVQHGGAVELAPDFTELAVFDPQLRLDQIGFTPAAGKSRNGNDEPNCRKPMYQISCQLSVVSCQSLVASKRQLTTDH
jgi:hypothetical protein